MTEATDSASFVVLFVSSNEDRTEAFEERRLREVDGVAALVASSVTDALDVLRNRSDVACVVSDDTLSAEDGVSLLEEVRNCDGEPTFVRCPDEKFDGRDYPVEVSALIRDAIEDRRTARALEERRKELTGIQRVVRLLESVEDSLEDLLSEVVELVPSSFQFPERTEACLEVDGTVVETGAFDPSNPSITAEAVTTNGRRIVLEVVVSEDSSERPADSTAGDRSDRAADSTAGDRSDRDTDSTDGEDLFLPEEQELLETIVRMLEGFLERRRYVDELEESENRFRLLAENVGEVVWMSDPEKERLHYVSPTYETVWGRSRQSLYDEPTSFLEHVHPEDRSRVESAIARQADGEYDEEYRIVRPDGEVRWVHDRAVPLAHDGGEVYRIVGLTRDVTERKEREQQLAVLDRVLRHNLRNEMNVALGIAERIVDDGDDRVARHGEEVAHVCERLLDLADKQRRIARILSAPRSPEPQDLRAVLDRVVDRVQVTYPDSSITLSGPEAGTITTTPHVEVAIAELLENAVVHSDRETPSVEVTVIAEPTVLEITVADDGPGIPTDDRTVLTDSEEPLYHGSGLGLWLVHWIVTHASGTISFEENEPRGSLVTIRLPRSTESTSAT